ncbi:hypothetical protein IQ238_06640 [Pleurocapsales cyanobacterium LEGE 06147]|nr:hypothetical protein [Pleurocapsales cyanobacterium LEGE 06147]
MFSSRGWQKFFNLNLDFWLFLPILGIAFWMGGEFLTDQVLSRPYDTTDEVEADTNTQVQLAFNVVVIQVQIDRELGFTEVEVKTNDSELKKLEFQFPVTEFEQIEMILARELGLSQEDVRKLARYELKN